MLIATSDGITAPQPRYLATIAASNPLLDLAVLQVVGDRHRADRPGVAESAVRAAWGLGHARLGDPIDIFGYPGIAGGALTYTDGVVSAFHTEGQIERAWILTDAEASGGSSGGPAVNREGALIGVLTDASIEPSVAQVIRTATDASMRRMWAARLSGGSLARLRPSNLARPLLGGLPPPPPPPPPPLADLLPTALPLEHAGCFRIENDRVLTFDELAANLGGTDEARSRLQTLGMAGERQPHLRLRYPA